MEMGKTCLACEKRTFHDKGSHHRCTTTSCDFIGWAWNQPVVRMGSGKGLRRPNCGNYMLHTIAWLNGKQYVLRCSCCDYAGVGTKQE